MVRSPEAHLCNNHAGLISMLMCHTCEVDGLSRQRSTQEHAFRQIWEEYLAEIGLLCTWGKKSIYKLIICNYICFRVYSIQD